MSDDPDTPLDENTLLASAYLDGVATTDERALVETSAEALAEVDALSQVKTVLGATIPPTSLAERESHLADALDVWERMSDRERAGEATPASGVDAAAAAAVTTPISTSDGRRGRSARGRRGGSSGASQWLLGAAATLVVVAGGAAVVRGLLADSDSDSNETAVVQDASDEAELSDLEAAEAAEVAGENVGSDFVPDPEAIEDEVASDGLFPDRAAGSEAMTDEATDAMEDSEDSDDAADSEDAMEEALPDAAETDADPGAEQPAPAPEIGRVELSTPDDLADYGSLAVMPILSGPATTDDIDLEPPFDSCEAEFGIEKVLEPASYQGQEVFVGVDLGSDTVYAWTDGCVLVLSVALPPPTTQP